MELDKHYRETITRTRDCKRTSIVIDSIVLAFTAKMASRTRTSKPIPFSAEEFHDIIKH